MAAIGVDSHSMPRWFTTPLAASAASFHPSKAHRATGWVSGPTSLNLMVPPPLLRGATASQRTAYAFRGAGRFTRARLVSFSAEGEQPQGGCRLEMDTKYIGGWPQRGS